MNIIITGGSGLIGTALTKSYLVEGHQVTIVSRFPDKIIHPDLKVIGWEKEVLSAAIADSDAVINLAGSSIAGSNPLFMRWNPKRKESILESRIRAGRILTELIQGAPKKPEVLIQASAIGYYGNVGPELVKETSPAGNDFLAEVCQLWEASTKSVESMGVRRIVVRIGLVFSQKGGLLQLLKLPFTLYLGGQIGDGKQHFSWIHIDDLVSAIRFLIDNKKNRGIYNLTAPNPVQNYQFSEMLGKALHKPAYFTIPGFVLKLLLGEASTLALDGRAVYPTRLLDSGFVFEYNQLPSALIKLTT